MNSIWVMEMEEGIKSFMWHESATYTKEKFLSNNIKTIKTNCKTDNDVLDKMLDSKKINLI